MSRVKFMYAVLSIAAGPAFVHGFHLGLTNLIGWRIVEWYREVRTEDRDLALDGFYSLTVMGPFLCASFALGGIVGSLACPVANVVGRKFVLLCINALVLFGVILMCFAYLGGSYEAFIIGRFMMGICAGVSSGVTPMYLIEISPCCLRGTVGSFYYVMVAVSVLYAYINGMESLLGDENRWPYIFVCCLPPACIHVLMLLFVPESPKYFFFNRDNEDEASEAVAWFQGEDIVHDMEQLKEEAEVFTEVGPVNLMTMFNNQILRSPLIITLVILLTQQLCGMDSVTYFSIVIFRELEYESVVSRNLAIGLATVNIVGAVISMILMDRVGRRALLLGSIGGMILSLGSYTLVMILMGINENVPQNIKGIAVFFLYIYVITYSLGTGTIPWFYVAELNNHHARPWAASIGLSLNWLMHFIIVMSFVSVWKEIVDYTFLIYIFVDLAAIAFIFFTMRETMDVESADIAEMFFD